VDVVFGQVARIHLDTVYDGLTISIAGRAERSEVESRDGCIFPDGMELFVVGHSLSDYVLSGSPAWHEDEGSYRDPSFFESILML
jgi:hypothetical protein